MESLEDGKASAKKDVLLIEEKLTAVMLGFNINNQIDFNLGLCF